MKKLDITQVSFFKPILDGLTESGVDIRPFLKSSGLNKFNLDNIDNYVPVDLMYAFFDDVFNQQGRFDLLEQFSTDIELLSLSQAWAMVVYTPDVFGACQLAVRYDNIINSHERASLTIDGEKVIYRPCFADHRQKRSEQADFISFALAINGFRLAGGDKWPPLEIHLQSEHPPNLDFLLPVGSNIRILLNQAATAIVFPTAMLPLPRLGSNISNNNSLTSMAGKVEALIGSTQIDVNPKIEYFSEIVDIPVRTLQRQLAMEDATFSIIVKRWRFKIAKKYLSESDLLIKEISLLLRYSNTSNFERAFRRWTNTTPEQYRNSLS